MHRNSATLFSNSVAPGGATHVARGEAYNAGVHSGRTRVAPKGVCKNVCKNGSGKSAEVGLDLRTPCD